MEKSKGSKSPTADPEPTSPPSRKRRDKHKPASPRIANSEPNSSPKGSTSTITASAPENRKQTKFNSAALREPRVIQTLLGQIKLEAYPVDPDIVFKSHKYQQLPAHGVVPLTNSNVIELFGPTEAEDAEASGNYVYCKAISTYPKAIRKKKPSSPSGSPSALLAPLSTQGGIRRTGSLNAGMKKLSLSADSAKPILKREPRMGDPINDCFGVQVYQNRTVVALADGCNWGSKNQEAARVACKVFLEYLKSKFRQPGEGDKIDVKNTKYMGHFLLRAFARAHEKILECRKPKDSKDTGGTTTLLGGVILELEEDAAAHYGCPWLFVCASVGDCKAFVYSPNTGLITDVTSANRRLSATDPGGRLGPYVGKDGGPDLRNLGLHMLPCEEGSLLLALTDGVHDNFDPEHLGLKPSDVGLEQSSWEENIDEVLLAKHMFCVRYMGQVVRGPDNDQVVTPEQATTRLLAHCRATTKTSRKWMTQNPSKRLPLDYEKFPGKMDHTTCIAVTIGHRESSFRHQAIGIHIRGTRLSGSPQMHTLREEKTSTSGFLSGSSIGSLASPKGPVNHISNLIQSESDIALSPSPVSALAFTSALALNANSDLPYVSGSMSPVVDSPKTPTPATTPNMAPTMTDVPAQTPTPTPAPVTAPTETSAQTQSKAPTQSKGPTHPILVTLGYTRTYLVAMCRVANKQNIKCKASANMLVLKTAKGSTPSLQSEYTLFGEDELRLPLERVVHLPFDINPSSLEKTKNEDGSYCFRFNRVPTKF
jgi:hypothetical protein